MDFRWIPHKGVDKDAVERMKQHFPRPTEAAHKAWFNSVEPWYFDELLAYPVSVLSTRQIVYYLDEVASGIENFGWRQDWADWFHYLLPYLVQRIVQGEYLLTSTIAYFMNLYPDEIVEEYSGFRDDVLLTLAQCMMTTEFWADNDLSEERSGYEEWHGYSFPLHACLFFCLKYLHSDEISSWVASLAEIKGAFWQSEISHWVNGLNRFFDYMEHPENVPDLDDVKKRVQIGTVDAYMEIAHIYWPRASCVLGRLSKNIYDYLPEANMETFWREVQKYPQLSFTDANL